MGGALAGLVATFTRKKQAIARTAVSNMLELLNASRSADSWRTAVHPKTATRLFLALTMIGIGSIGLFGGGFAPIWLPVPETAPAREVLAYACTLVSLACGAGLLVKRTAAPAALGLLIYLLVWTALFKVPFIFRAPLVEVSYQSTGENAVLIAAAWVLYAAFAKTAKFPAGDLGLRVAYVLYGLALVAFGLSHFFYLQMTAPLVPAWLPGKVFWAYFTGGLYLAAGAAMVTGVAARAGAVAAAVQITLITLLVWGPMVLAGPMTAMHEQETVVSWALTAAAWVLATSFEGQPWLDRFRASGLRPKTGERRVPSR
jgi:uncharacterized membrane protein